MKPLLGLIMAAVLTATAACGTKGPGGGAAPSPAASAVSPSAAPPSAASPSAVPSQTPAPAVTTTGAGADVVSSRVAYPWQWPSPDRPATVTHRYPMPPVPQLIRIGAGDHPSEPGERPYNRMTFTFDTAMPSYTVQFVDHLVADGSGATVPLRGLGVLRVTFHGAQAHTADGTGGTIRSRPPADLGMRRMVDYAAAGDYEGVVTYGIGIAWPYPHSNPQIAVRVYEVVRVDARGARQYVVAVDVDAR